MALFFSRYNFAVLFYLFYKTLQDFIPHHYWRSHSVGLGMVLDAAIHVMGELRPYSEVICIPLYSHDRFIQNYCVCTCFVLR